MTIAYAGVWLALAMLFSILFRSAATAALVTLGLWLFLTLIWPVLAGASRQIIVPPDPRYTALGLQTPGPSSWQQILARLSPSTLFGEMVVAMLNPATRALGPIYLSQLQGAVLGAPLPLGESIMIAWPQIVGMIADRDRAVRRSATWCSSARKCAQSLIKPGAAPGLRHAHAAQVSFTPHGVLTCHRFRLPSVSLASPDFTATSFAVP